MKKSSYSQGHDFEQRVSSMLKCTLNPNLIVTNFLFQKYPTFEIDVVCIVNNKIVLIECKDYAGNVHLDKQNNIMLYRENRINNFVNRFNKKVKTFNRKFKVNAVGIILLGDDSIASGFPHWYMSDIPKIKKLIGTLPPSDVNSVLTYCNHDKQSELRKGVSSENGKWK